MDREIAGKIENPLAQVEGFLCRSMKATGAVAFRSLVAKGFLPQSRMCRPVFVVNGGKDVLSGGEKAHFNQIRIGNKIIEIVVFLVVHI
ncbi:MAG: hypothetical protein NBV76_10005 [Candidatus Ochrobactrum gambitense]|nr:MAG: hypothetical protein NBV76_10005 [Candidatus Ochrobactrum gambitense]WEK16348.1 MAG: hypothetical protein P0Y54_00960 [Candidatus Ochrobactrum gambitense]